jgi:2-dehydropantoate 2-reductase
MMQKIQRVAILGAGAIGSIFATKFFDTPGFSTVLIARDARLEALRREGILVNGKPYHIPALSPEEAVEPVDLILVALKHHHMQQAIPNLGKLVGESTVFVSAMNGLESEEYIGSLYGMHKVLYAITLKVDAVRTGNQVTYTRPGVLYFGEAQNSELSPKVRRVQEAFEQARIGYETPEDMLRMLWWKFMFNVGINQASAVMRASYGAFQTDSEAKTLMNELMGEVVALAEKMRVNLSGQDIQSWYPILNSLSPLGKTSMLQDIEAGRKTEVDVFGGTVIALGKQHGVPTPINQTVVRIIHALEQNFER